MSIAAKLVRLVEEERAVQAQTQKSSPEMTPAMYAQLRGVARSIMRGERPGHTLQPTAVVHETFMRLARADIAPADAKHFFRIAAQTMRHVLVDYARARCREKRDTPCVEEMQALTGGILEPFDSATPLEVLDFDRALESLALRSPRAVELLELRYFAGLDDPEICVIYGVSEATVTREIRFAKAFLVRFAKTHSMAANITEQAGVAEMVQG